MGALVRLFRRIGTAFPTCKIQTCAYAMKRMNGGLIRHACETGQYLQIIRRQIHIQFKKTLFVLDDGHFGIHNCLYF